MATFPTLKTGAVAQYPLGWSARYSTQAVQFLDGSQQKFRLYPAGLRRWTVQLSNLDETELDTVITFVEQLGGALFSFPDPVTGVTAATCRIAGEQFSAGMAGDAALMIEEVA
jgi:hypothetical protein